ncbi:hypothetical protein [Catenuloplanes atrovinosus]|uniref:Uncharacterized protein n=1 Tax=Catenuloplanes atrovinosus TaxID=137266 RepID=A0AAE4C9I8_9ACTN|nr:hypothetical protein [Catenuloplanes atrovinosus]MDR7275862.1 hypothetical protein [Catenuloplanes atrovinosus]
MTLSSDVGDAVPAPKRKGRHGGGIMAAARAASEDEAPATDITVLLPKISTDPVDDLVEKVRPKLGKAVDALQVAALLESDGHTDRAARVEYGYTDVFALALEVYRRMGPPSPVVPDEAPPAGPAHGRRDALRTLAHGPLYVLPSAAFPAVLAMVGLRALVIGLVAAGALGWVLSGTAAHAAYRMLGLGRDRSAARILFWSAVAGPPLGLLLGAVVALGWGGGPELVAMMTGQLAYQMASTLLVFYRRELWLALSMVPAFAVGALYLVLGGPGLQLASVGVTVLGVAAAYAFSLMATTRREGEQDRPEPPLLASLRPERGALIGVTGYGLASAALLFHAQAPYLLGRLDIAVAAVPLILCMGFVEWRANRFWAETVALTRRVHRPAHFVTGVWRRIVREVLACLAAPAVAALPLLIGLELAGLLTPAGVLMTAAHVALAGAYYLAFLLAGRGRFGWLCVTMAVAIALHLVPAALLRAGPVVDTSLYLGSVLTLLGLFAAGLVPVIGQARHYR